MKHLPKWFRAHQKRDSEVIRKYAMGVKDAMEVLDSAFDPPWVASTYLKMEGMLKIDTDDWWAMGFVGHLIDISGTPATIEYRTEKEGRAMSKGYEVEEIVRMLTQSTEVKEEPDELYV